MSPAQGQPAAGFQRCHRGEFQRLQMVSLGYMWQGPAILISISMYKGGSWFHKEGVCLLALKSIHSQAQGYRG